jgi:hypothetical protein
VTLAEVEEVMESYEKDSKV